MSRSGTVRVGISGWTYGGWRGSFYPPGLPPSDELGYASRRVDTIEINGTHYSLQRPDSFGRWHDETPEGFVFAVKGSRFITHLKSRASSEITAGVKLLGAVQPQIDEVRSNVLGIRPRHRVGENEGHPMPAQQRHEGGVDKARVADLDCMPQIPPVFGPRPGTAGEALVVSFGKGRRRLGVAGQQGEEMFETPAVKSEPR
ncbi:MAG TPA: DUF72 domain-containing protein [Stellaceae bacterium]|nr:DUF72 domain-containing protein [Stellaceae bacterium]